jgi:hypothetical protein
MDNKKAMIKRFTYRELTVLIGVIVAVIVIFTLWVRQPFGHSILRFPLAEVEKARAVAVKEYINVFEALRSNRNNPY